MEKFSSLRGLDWSHIRLSYVTHFYANKNNGEELLALFDEYASLPPEILDRVLFVVVDDGSPSPYRLKDWPLNMIVLRIKEDIPWNNPGSRNLGLVYAKSDQVIVTDIDHSLERSGFQKLLRMPPCGRKIWRLPRVTPDGQRCGSHANSFLLSRGQFLKNYGYDEELCGHYACDDTFFMKYQKYHGSQQWMLPACAALHIRAFKEYTHTLSRDMSHNKALVADKLKRIKTYGAQAGHSRQFLSFEWEIVTVTRRGVPPPEKKDPFWALSWWGRWVTGE